MGARINDQLRLNDRDARTLRAAAGGNLQLITQYGAVLYCEDRSGSLPSYLPPPEPELMTNGLRLHGEDGTLTLTGIGTAALVAYGRHRAELDALPFTLTRNPCRDELHRGGEPIRILRDAATGREIPPGTELKDRAGHIVTYLGPTMSSSDRGMTWAPAFTARVRYGGYGALPLLPSELGTLYDADPLAGPGTVQGEGR